MLVINDEDFPTIIITNDDNPKNTNLPIMRSETDAMQNHINSSTTIVNFNLHYWDSYLTNTISIHHPLHLLPQESKLDIYANNASVIFGKLIFPIIDHEEVMH